MKSKYSCPECHGSKEVDCCECGHTVDCDACDGSGLNGELIDIKAFKKADYEAFHPIIEELPLMKNARRKKKKKTDDSPKREFISSWDWIENGQHVGRTGGERIKGRCAGTITVRYSDFLFEKMRNPLADPLAYLDEQPQQPSLTDPLAWIDS